MKFSTLLLLFFLTTSSLFAQHKTADETVRIFLTQFNNKKYDDVYDSFSQNYQQQIPRENFKSYLNQVYGMAGKFKSSKFISKKDNIYTYFLDTPSGDVNSDFQFSIDENQKINFISFKRIGGSGNPPPISKMN